MRSPRRAHDLPRREDVSIDKSDQYWLLTYYTEAVWLRMRILHSGDGDLDTWFFEVQLPGASEFVLLGQTDGVAIEHSETWPSAPDVSAFPTHWRAEFLRLTRLWSAIDDKAQLASTLGDGRVP